MTPLETLSLPVDTLVDQVVDALREQILTGAIPPGAKLRQQECAEELGVSRTPLREAFHRLQAEGWVDLPARQGAVVRPFSAAEAEDIFAMRILLETFAARLAAVAHTPGDEARVRALLDDMDGLGDADAAEHDDANYRFHEQVYGLRSPGLPAELAASLRRHWDRAARYRRFHWTAAETAGASRAWHERIHRAWSARDADATERAVAGHILSALQDISDRLDPQRPLSPPILMLAARYGVELDSSHHGDP